MAVKDFNPDCGDPAYTMGIVDLLLECVDLSYRPGKVAHISVCTGRKLKYFSLTT